MYIDFETLGPVRSADGPRTGRPLLLGVLDDAAGFRQFIVDPVLHSAARARPCATSAAFDVAVASLVDNDGPIVAWSNYDLEVIKERSASKSIMKAVESRYVNALDSARAWRRTVRPSLELSLDRRGRETHGLKDYMRHVGYQVPRELSPGQAAKWAQHVLDQTGSQPRGYRDATARAKRHWHYLLEYNLHDCAGLKAVHQRAERELALWSAYTKTTFKVMAPSSEIHIRVGWNPRSLRKLLESARADSWGFITASNPQSKRLTADENAERHDLLVQRVNRRRWRSLPGIGVGDDKKWPPETSLLVLGISRQDSLELGRKFDQLAVVWGHREGRAELVPCEPRIHRKP